MRHAAALALCLGLVAGSAQAMPAMAVMHAAAGSAPASIITKVEYFCSPGFEPSYAGTCVAVASRAEVELFVEHPLYDDAPVVLHRHRRHHGGMRERY